MTIPTPREDPTHERAEYEKFCLDFDHAVRYQVQCDTPGVRNVLMRAVRELENAALREEEHRVEVVELFRKFSLPQPVALCNHDDMLRDATAFQRNLCEWHYEEHEYDEPKEGAPCFKCAENRHHTSTQLLALAQGRDKALRTLCAAVEHLHEKATLHTGKGEFVSHYLVPVESWHALLALARSTAFTNHSQTNSDA